MTPRGVAGLTAHWFGDRAVMVTLPAGDLRLGVTASLERRFPDLVVRAGMESVLVEASRPTPRLLDEVRDAVALIDPIAQGSEGRRPEVVIPVSYSGEDLPEVAEALGTSIPEVIHAHQQQPWTVAMMGFAPGFAYLVPDDRAVLDWAVLARRERPREQVPPGSVAIAAGMSAIYPTAMPGGWHLIGRTSLQLFDPVTETDPTVLRPGDRIRFRDRSS
jgi:KipI family sensor histidine kinase inhibitor